MKRCFVQCPASDLIVLFLLNVHLCRYNASGLREISLEFIMRNLNDPTVAESLHDLKSDPDLLVEIIRRTTTSPALAGIWADNSDIGGTEWSER